MFKTVLTRILDGVLNHPYRVLIPIGLLVVIALAGLPRFKLDASADALTLENDSDLTYFREVSKNYGSSDFLVVTYTPKSGELFEAGQLAHLQRFEAELAEVPGVTSVNSILTVPLLYTPKRPIREIATDPLTLLSPGVDLQAAKQEFLTSPLYKELILAEDGETATAVVHLRRPDLDARKQRAREQGLQPATGEDDGPSMSEDEWSFERHNGSWYLTTF